MHMEIPFIRTAVLCVDMCVCVGFPLRGHSLSPCVILASRSHLHCEIPTPVERIRLKRHQCVFLCRSVRVALYVHVERD